MLRILLIAWVGFLSFCHPPQNRADEAEQKAKAAAAAQALEKAQVDREFLNAVSPAIFDSAIYRGVAKMAAGHPVILMEDGSDQEYEYLAVYTDMGDHSIRSASLRAGKETMMVELMAYEDEGEITWVPLISDNATAR